MHFRTLGLILLFLSLNAFAQGRSPAVEDFVGIEVDHPETTPGPSGTLFNLENDVSKLVEVETFQNNPQAPKVRESPAKTPMSKTGLFSIALFVFLPLTIWFSLMNRLRQKATIESASNIEILEQYRKERESRKNQEIKKAS